VVGIPLKDPGSTWSKSKAPSWARRCSIRPGHIRPTAVLVTNLAVHFKQGRESSLAWVTTLDKAEPVAGAVVSVMNCAGKLLWSGATDADGVARIDAELPRDTADAECRFDLPEHDYSQLGALRGWGRGSLSRRGRTTT